MKRLPIIAMLLLGACSLASTPDTGKAYMATLPHLLADQVTCSKHINGNLVVAYPLVPEDLDTYRIAILDKDRRDYLARMRWAEFLPGLIQSAFTQSISNVGNAFTDDQVVSARWQLLTEVRRFEVTYDANETPSKAVIDMRFELRKGDGPQVNKQFVLSQAIPIRANKAEAIVQAFRTGFAQIQVELVSKLAGCDSAGDDTSAPE